MEILAVSPTPEPEDEEGFQPDDGDEPQHLNVAVDEVLARAAEAGGQRQGRPEGHADGKAPEDALERRPQGGLAARRWPAGVHRSRSPCLEPPAPPAGSTPPVTRAPRRRSEAPRPMRRCGPLAQHPDPTLPHVLFGCREPHHERRRRPGRGRPTSSITRRSGCDDRYCPQIGDGHEPCAEETSELKRGLNSLAHHDLATGWSRPPGRGSPGSAAVPSTAPGNSKKARRSDGGRNRRLPAPA